MGEERVVRVRGLLEQAKAAHIPYEAEVLGGVYDDEWARWYAEHMINNGFRDAIGSGEGGIDVERLAELLAEADVQHRLHAPDEDWPPYYARYLVNALTSDTGAGS